jgi:hypothetical protein
LKGEKRVVKMRHQPLVETFVPLSYHGKLRVGGKAIINQEDPMGEAYETLILQSCLFGG